MYVIAGATGKVGGTIARKLNTDGKQLRLMVRTEAKAKALRDHGADVTIGNVRDEASLTASLNGAEGAFLLLPPDYPELDVVATQHKMVDAMVAAVRAAGVKHVVLLSSVGAQHPTGTGPIAGLHYAERAFVGSGASCTFIRAAYFMENFGGVLTSAMYQGILPNFLDDKRSFQMVATQDIGELAARVLVAPPAQSGSSVIELAGPRDYTIPEAMEIISKVIGRQLLLVNVPEATHVPALMQAGLPEHLAKVFAEMYAGINSGHVAFERPAQATRGHVTLDQVITGLLTGIVPAKA